jgi:hypothetical protein
LVIIMGYEKFEEKRKIWWKEISVERREGA